MGKSTAPQLPIEEKREKVGLWLRPSIYTAMRHAAIDENCSVSELVEKLWGLRTTVIRRG